MNNNTATAADDPPPEQAEDLRAKLDRLEQKLDRLNAARDPDRLLDANEVADLLGVSRRTVSTLTAEGSLTKIKVGRSVRYSREAVNAFVRRCAGEGRKR